MLPLNLTVQGTAIQGYVQVTKQLAETEGLANVDFSKLDSAAQSFVQASHDTYKRRGLRNSLIPLNDRVTLTERQFLSDEGLPGRKWFKHVLQAPGLYVSAFIKLAHDCRIHRRCV